jgi:ribose transport system substrate-binding protein
MLFSVDRRLLLALAVVIAAIGLTACGGGGDSTTSATAESTAGESESTGGNDSAIAEAEEIIEPFIGQPSPFPVVDKLKEVPKGAEISCVQAGNEISVLYCTLAKEAGEAMGVKVTPVDAGFSAAEVSSALDTVVATKPDAAIVIGPSIQLWSKQAKELQEAEIPIVAAGIIGAEQAEIVAPQAAEAFSEESGELLAAYVAAEWGPDSNVVFYGIPELEFSGYEENVFLEKMASFCPECPVRTVAIPLESLGNKAPNTIVSDLQANPDTNAAVMVSAELLSGLPAALRTAGLDKKVKTMGVGPSPATLQILKEGKTTAALGFDLAVAGWEVLDQAARQIVGQEITGPAAEGKSDMQFLRPEDITFDPSMGWTGYPDFKEKFESLWGV